MPGVSTHSKIDNIFTALCSIPEFKYSEDELWEFVAQTSMKIKKPSRSTKPRHTSAYSMFLKETKTGMDDTADLAQKWATIKENAGEEFEKFQNMAEQKDKENGLDSLASTKSTSQTTEKKLRIELIEARIADTEDAHKPIFPGVKPDSIVNCYKEWKKSILGLTPNDTISRDDLKNYKTEDEFDDKNMDGRDWDNYIRNNMAFASDI
tara:strand:- start:482 stop:1105 length:624 start_codon:yes stop_codon:yes gene_type:complete